MKKDWNVTFAQCQHDSKDCPQDQILLAYVCCAEPNVIRLCNVEKDEEANRVMAEQASEMLSHESLHGVMFQIGEPIASAMFDNKYGAYPLDESGMGKS